MTNDTRLAADDVKAFVFGRTLDCFSAESGELSATITYATDGTCHLAMVDGRVDDGRYGFERDLYWTRYSWFREGGVFRFYLTRVDEVTCQASFDDGTKAFLQRIKE